MLEFKGEKLEQVWVGNEHVASIREASGHGEGPFIIETVDGVEIHQAGDLHLAELWVAQHSDSILGRPN
ncbi:hypothetical protein SAMN06295879_1771 [Agreia bicolorata]|uniref:Uncharacterized protein n=1 Tax=Agreia bicolorata TaxID=110935 RepID=A0A1T4XXD0_9MICO|nr:hypothetical protein [Agreia bicolorata]SKA93715.1 hypothetical protein SAMN06295879_1771 [Agreia bicolorata]